jgi:hypothetical protein
VLRHRAPWLALRIAAAASAWCACAPQQPALSTAERDIASVQARLTAGPWRLVDYRPDVPLDPITQTLLATQVRTMVITFDGRAMHAQSPTFDVTRPYAVQEAAEFVFDIVSPDVQGAGVLRSHCWIDESGRRITFHAETDPWNGTGVLEREGM